MISDYFKCHLSVEEIGTERLGGLVKVTQLISDSNNWIQIPNSDSIDMTIPILFPLLESLKLLTREAIKNQINTCDKFREKSFFLKKKKEIEKNSKRK